MDLLIDTDIAIRVRDGNDAIIDLLAENGRPVLSVLSLAELEAGAAADGSRGSIRRSLLEVMLRRVQVLPYTPLEARSYGHIIEALGYDRRRVLDRMIAAQAITAGIPLATINGRDFEDIPGLDVRIWAIS